jgi:alanine racemase
VDRRETHNEFAYAPKLAGLDDIGSSLITLAVDLAQYRNNLRELLALAHPAKLIAVVKANAYGLGVAGLLPILSEFEDISLGVANADEALELKALGYQGRIILLGYTHPKNYYQIVHSGCQLCAYRSEGIPALAEACRELRHPLELHVKVDTGMVRLGVSVGELGKFLTELKRYPQIAVVGLFSHLVDSGDAGAEINYEQELQFLRAADIAAEVLGYMPERHLANSGALVNFPRLHLDAVRVGLLAYGVQPPGTPAGPLPTRPCLRLASEVIDIHHIRPGQGVSYGHTWHAVRPTTVATLPLGYADGLPRELSNKLQVLINGQRCPAVGNITMDYVIVETGGLPVAIGDEAVFIGGQGEVAISLEQLAGQAGKLAYEITCGLGRRVRRVYFE